MNATETFEEKTFYSEKARLCNSLSDGDDTSAIPPHSRNSILNNCVKIFPSKAELSVINNSIQCIEEKCQEIFTSYSNLNLHLYKTHNRKDAIQFDSKIKQFHCPEIQCIYHQAEWFKSKKLLKQHYLKVHSPKTYICGECQEGFPTEAYKKMHMDYCGIKFKCCECSMNYPKYESLLTHSRRKGHKINEKIYYKLKKLNTILIISGSKSDSNLPNKTKSILPKLKANVESFTDLKFIIKKSDQSIQTDHVLPKLKSKITQINRNSFFMNRDTQQTQTGLCKVQSSIETQTIGDYFKRKKMEHGEKKLVTAQSSTQTRLIPSKSVASNTLLPVNDLGLTTSKVKRNSSSTQTFERSPNDDFSSTTNTHDTIDTDTSDLIESNLETFDSNFFNCNMETQTDLIFNEDLFVYGDYYSNMYTQTCEDLFLNSLEFNNIETQTVDDMLKSVEIQTISQKKSQITCRDRSHMETQTDMEFKDMLEHINA